MSREKLEKWHCLIELSILKKMFYVCGQCVSPLGTYEWQLKYWHHAKEVRFSFYLILINVKFKQPCVTGGYGTGRDEQTIEKHQVRDVSQV